MPQSGWRMAAPCPTTTSRRRSPVRANLLEVPVRKRGIKRHQQAITNDCRNLSYTIVLRCIRIFIIDHCDYLMNTMIMMCSLLCFSTAKESTLHLVLRLRGGVIEPSLAEPRLMRSTDSLGRQDES